ncbi:spermatogenesis-associated protein 31A6-like [Urocitellus parryii]
MGQQGLCNISEWGNEEPWITGVYPCTTCPTSCAHLLLAEACASISCSHLQKLQDDSSFHQLIKGDDPDKSAGVHQSHTLPVEDTLATAFFPLASLISLSKRPLLLASTSSPDLMTSSDTLESHSSLGASKSRESLIPLEQCSPQPHRISSPQSHSPDHMAHCASLPSPSLNSSQCDSMTLSLGTNPQSSSPPKKYWLPSPVPLLSPVSSPSPGPSSSPVPLPFPVPLPSPLPEISGHIISTCPISSLSWWQMAARVCDLSHSPHSKSKRDHASHPPEDSLWGNDPHSQVETEETSFINSNTQKLLEILISKRAERKICNLKTKNETVYSLNSQGSKVKSLGREQNTTIWNTKGKSEKLSDSQKLFYTRVLRDHLQKKCSQFFWGLPILHSESLVATVRISGPSADFSSIAFNEVPNYIPVQVQTTPGPLFSSQLLHPLVQLQPVIPSLSWLQSPSLAQIHHQEHLTLSLPSMPCHFQLNTASGFPCPTNQEGIQLLSSSSLQHLEYHILRKQVQSREALPYLVQKSQNIFSNLISENRASCDHKSINKPPGNFLSLEIKEKLEQHLQKWFMLHQYGLPPNRNPFLNLKESWDNISRRGQAKENCESSWNPVFLNNRSPPIQKTSSKRPEIIQEDMIPVGVWHSRLGIYHVFGPPGNSKTHKKTGDETSLKGGEAFRNTSQEISLLDAGTQQALEAHVTSLRAKHRWDLPLKVLKHINILKMRNSEASLLPQPSLSSSVPCDSRVDSIAHDARVLGKPIQKGTGLKEIAQTSVSTQKSPFSGPSFESLSRTTSSDNYGLSDAPSTVHKGSLPSQPHTYILVGRTWHNDAVLRSGRNSLKPSLGLEMDRNESLESSVSSQVSCHSVSSLQVGPQFLKGEVRKIEDDEEESSDWGITKKIRKTSNFLNVDIHLKNLKSQWISKTPSSFISSISQSQGYSCLKAQTNPEKQPQEWTTDIILQDCATDMFHEDCGPEALWAANILTSEERWSSSLSMTSSSASISQDLYGLLTSEESSEELQEPKITELQDPWKSRRNKFRATSKNKDSVKLRSKAQEERLAGGRPLCAGEMGPSTPVREIGDTVSYKSFQAPSKRNFRDRIKNFLQNIFCSNTKGQVHSLPKIMTPSTSNQSQGSVTGRLLTDNRASETQALISTFGWIIEQKMRFHYEHSALKTNKVKEEYQASMGR